MAYTRLQKRTEIGRELTMRRRVYPRMVAQGRMSDDDARRWIAIMEAIYDDYVDENKEQRAFKFEEKVK